jgi:membrane protein DedA with SNARE-associated domain
MDNVIPFLIQHGYVLLFLWVLAETMGLPIPAAPLFVAAGALAGAGQMSLLLCIVLGVSAALLADTFWYLMGRIRGMHVLSLLCRISLEPDSCMRRTEDIFARYGARSLLMVKFLPGLSAVSTPLAGTIRMSPLLFLLFDGLGSVLWVGVYMLIGYIFSEELDRALAVALGMGKTLLVLVAAGLSLYILQKYVLRRRFLRELSIARITPEELKRKLDAGEDILIIDVRHDLDFQADPSVIPGTLRIPLERFEADPDIPRGREVVVYCT